MLPGTSQDIVAFNKAVQVAQAILLEVELIFGIHAVSADMAGGRSDRGAAETQQV
jgi:hypothetical protein